MYVGLKQPYEGKERCVIWPKQLQRRLTFVEKNTKIFKAQFLSLWCILAAAKILT